MSRKLDDLSPRFRPLAFELLARITEAGICVLIVDTLRSAAEQEENIRKGVSWTKDSKHLTGDAIDIVPYDEYQLHGADKLQWTTNDATWQILGSIGKKLGLRWGGDWTVKDMGHFEYQQPRQPGEVQRRA